MKSERGLIFRLCLLGMMAFVFFAMEKGRGATYYVDSQGGSDSNSGTSEQAAWQTLDKVNDQIFYPADQILFKCGSIFDDQLQPRGNGNASNVITIDCYGEGDKPQIRGNEASALANGETNLQSAVWLRTIKYWEVNNLDISFKSDERAGWRIGVRVTAFDCGEIPHIVLRDLYIHDVNGELKTSDGGGFGIYFESTWSVPSWYDGLLIENCHLARIQRDGICGSSRFTSGSTNKYYSENVVIRNNLLEYIAGSCIRLWGCSGALVENNVVRDSGTNHQIKLTYESGESKQYASGIWPYECENTCIQNNEVYNFRADGDGQAFDSDWNCTGTLIQYNYSHDNTGFALLCTPSDDDTEYTDPGLGNQGTVIRYNISQNDGLRELDNGRITPVIELVGQVKNAKIYNNTIYNENDYMDSPSTPPPLVRGRLWIGGTKLPEDILMANNIFYINQQSVGYELGSQPGEFTFDSNAYWGTFTGSPTDLNAVTTQPYLYDAGSGLMGLDSLNGYHLEISSPCVDAGLAISDNGDQDFYGVALDSLSTPDIGAAEAKVCANLLNGGFEETLYGASALGWGLNDGAFLLTRGAPEGNVFCRLDDHEPDGDSSQANVITDPFYTDSQKSYTISFHARISYWDSGDHPLLQLSYLDSASQTQWEDVWRVNADPPAPDEWRHYCFEFTGKDAMVYLVGSANGAQLDLDQVQVEEIQNEIGINLLSNHREYNGGFEYGTWWWPFYYNGQGFEVTSDEVDDGWYALVLNENQEYVRHKGANPSTTDLHLDSSKTYQVSYKVKVDGYAGAYNNKNPRVGYCAYDDETVWEQSGGASGWTTDWHYDFTADTDGWVAVTTTITGVEIIQPYASWYMPTSTPDGLHQMLIDSIAIREVEN